MPYFMRNAHARQWKYLEIVKKPPGKPKHEILVYRRRQACYNPKTAAAKMRSA
jgi:hypothetical protein